MTSPHPTRKTGPAQVILRIVLMAALCTFALAACHSPQTPQSAATERLPAAPEPAPAQSGTAHQRSPFVTTTAGTAAVAAGADNYKDLLKRFPEAKQAQIKAWYAQYAAGSMSFTSNAQWQWMQKHDYPTPDDVLRASSISETQLRELATHGDVKANFFYLARLLEDHAQADEASAAPSHDKARLQTEMTASMDRALASGSAFSGYLFGSYYTALHGREGSGIGTATGLLWADTLGDSNGPFHNQQMAMGFPGVSGVRVAEVYFDMFTAAARVNPYFLNARHGQGGLFIPLQ